MSRKSTPIDTARNVPRAASLRLRRASGVTQWKVGGSGPTGQSGQASAAKSPASAGLAGRRLLYRRMKITRRPESFGGSR